MSRYVPVAFFSLCVLGALVIEDAKADTTTEKAGIHAELSRFMTEGKAYLDARYRFEYVDQDGITEEAKASTLRSRLGFVSGTVYDLQAKVEVEDVTVIGNDTYNSTTNGETDFPVVADPDGTEINEAWLSYAGIPDTRIRGGREALKLDNVRFIGDVGWRQNNQTYDGVNLVNKSVSDLKLFYGFVGNVNRIFGEDSPVGDFDTTLNLFNAQLTAIPAVTLTAYAYLLDVDDADNLSTSNFGARAHGSYPLAESFSLLYDGEYAYQQDYEDNPVDFSTHYWRASLGGKFHGISVVGGFESLGSDDGAIGFSTPFATLHKWNGWADKFLTTPDDGLQDAFAKVSYSAKDVHRYLAKLSADVVYHYFSAEEGNRKYGSEWDFNMQASLCSFFSLGVKYALYDSANFATDTDKLIFTAHVKLSQ